MTTVERLDYSKPPLGYTADGQWWSYPSPRPRHPLNIGPDSPLTNVATVAPKDGALAAAWSHYKEHRDPPGLAVMSFRALAMGLPDHEARAAAWAWYDRRLAVADRLGAEVVVVRSHGHEGDEFDDVLVPRGRVAGVVAQMLYLSPDADDVADAEGDTARLLAEGILSFEGDPPITCAPVDVWPRCLTWSDVQIATVERWLVDSTAEMPEVLR